MTSYKYMSDGLGGHVGLSCSPDYTFVMVPNGRSSVTS